MADEWVNPYIAGAPVTEARMFFGREDVFDWIQNSLVGKYADHILVIHGQRRVGKTSVLKQLSNRLPKRYIPVFFDLQGRTHTTLDRFLWWLAREIVRVLKQERGMEIQVPDKDAFSTDLEYFETHFLANLLPTLESGSLLLTFDEFDNLEDSEIKETLARPLVDYLRRLMGRQGLNFIFSIGSSGRKLENMQADYTDFFKSALYKKISFLNEEQTHNLITRPVEGILDYDRPAVNRIYKIAGGHPYFTQLTCHELFAGCQRTGETRIREKDVESVLDDVVERGTVNLKFVWDEASDIEKWALASLAHLDKADTRALTDSLRRQRVRFSESDLTSGLLHLREKDILTSENRFVIHLLRLWLQKNRPIEQVREELTEVNPIANRYIEIGQEFKNSGQYQKAIESFQEALAVSAGNIQAQVSIALVYMDQKAYDRAVGEFEKALTIDDEDVTARTGLCEAHLALGDAAMQKGRWKEAAQSYQRVLGINAEHTEARQRMAEIHRQRAEKLLTDGRDEEALNAFVEALKYAPEDESLAARMESVKAEKKAKIVAAQVARSEKEAGARNWEAAIRTLEEAQSLAPDDPNIQKRLTEVRERLRESKLAALKSKAQSAVKAERFGDALKTWQEYLSLEPTDREKTEEEMSRLQKLVELEVTYNEAQQAINEKSYDKAISLLKQVIVQDENFKDTSRLLTQAIELRRSSRPAPITLPIAKILKGLLIVIGIAGLGIGGYFAWSRWGSNIASLFSGGSKIEKVCLLTTGMDDARSYWNGQISKSMDDVAKGYKLESKTFITQMVKEEYEAKLTSMIKTEKCDLILGNGKWLRDAFYQFAKEYPKVKFSLIDVFMEDFGHPLPGSWPENLIGQTFKTFDSGYMAGYLAAGLTKTGKVGTFAAENGTDEMEYMKGFHGGVNEYNQKHNTQVQLIGFDPENGSGLFANGYQRTDENMGAHQKIAETLIYTDNVDVLFIVSSPEASMFALSAIAKANTTKGAEVKIIGTDVDWAAYFSAAGGPSGDYESANLCITSATKDFERTVKDVIIQALEGTYKGETIEGNGKNQGVGLSPINESLFTIPDELKADLAQFQYKAFGVIMIPESASAFVKPIQSYIDTTTPTLEDDFSKANDSWSPLAEGITTADVLKDGVLNLNVEAGTPREKYVLQGNDMRAKQFVLEFDFYYESATSTRLGIGFPPTHWDIDLESRKWGIGTDLATPEYSGEITDTEPLKGKWAHLQVMYYNAQMAVFLNNKFVGYAEGINHSNDEIWIFAMGGQAQVTIDNVKFWNLDNFTSASAPPPTQVAAPLPTATATLDPAIQIALDAIQINKPLYQTSFDTWEFGDPVENVKVENGKLILSSENQEGATVDIYNLNSDRYAIEYELSVREGGEGSHCVSENSDVSLKRGLSFAFFGNGQTDLNASGSQIATGSYDETQSNKVTLLILGNQLAAVVNGQISYFALDPEGSVSYARISLSAYYKIVCEIDNYKIWDLSGVDFSGTTGTAVVTPTAIPNKTPNTSLPSWVTDIAQPILDNIDGRTPNTQENFDLGIPNWVKLYYYGDDCLEVVNGEMIDRCLSYWTMWYTDYVVEMNIRFTSASESKRWLFYFRNFGEGFYFHPDGLVEANIEGSGSYELSSWGFNYRKVLIIVHDQFAAVFVDDQPLLSVDLEPRWKNGNAYWSGAPVAFDYIKIWDLNNINNSP